MKNRVIDPAPISPSQLLKVSSVDSDVSSSSEEHDSVVCLQRELQKHWLNCLVSAGEGRRQGEKRSEAVGRSRKEKGSKGAQHRGSEPHTLKSNISMIKLHTAINTAKTCNTLSFSVVIA